MLTDEGYGALLATVHRVDLLSRRVADVQLQTNIGVGRSMFLILELLSRLDRSGTSQRVIADGVGLTKAAVSRQLAIAQQEGLVAVGRATESRRENKVMLTTAGRRLVQRGRRHRARAVQEATAALGVDEMARATRTLVQLADLLEQRLRARP